MSDPNGIVPLNSVPYNGGEVQPYYESPVNGMPVDGYPIQVPEQVVPMLNSLSRKNAPRTQRSAVQPVSYNQPIADAAAPKEQFKPVAARIINRGSVTTRPIEPQRDNVNNAGVQRIRATTPVNGKVRVRKIAANVVAQQPKNNNTSGVKSTSTRTNAAVSRNSNIDWERLGLTRPEHSTERTRARIKAN